MKKIMILLLACILCAGILPGKAAAASAAEVAFTSVEGGRGESVVLTAEITGNPGFMALSAALSYDSSVLELSTFTAGDLTSGAAVNSQTGMISFSKSENVTGDGILFTATFRIADTAPFGTTSVSASFELYGENDYKNPLDIAVKEGLVNVTHEHIWSGWTVTKQASCEETGEKIRSCSVCGETEKEIIAVDETAHDWGEWTVTKEATQEEEGEETRVCKNNPDHKETRSIPMKEKDTVSAESITLNKASVTLAALQTMTLEAVVLPENASDRSVTWSGGNQAASVDQNGTVTAKTYGTSVITATANDRSNGTLSADCVVHVLFRDVTGSGTYGAPGYQYYYNPVYWAADAGITKGYTSGEYAGAFGVGLNCQRRELMIFLWRYSGSPTGYGDARTMFNDLAAYGANTDTNKAIAWGYQEGIVRGYSDGGFHPTASIQRKDVMIMLYRLAGKPAVSGSVPFTDVTTDIYPAKNDTYRAILWGVKQGITNGYSSGEYAGQFGCLLPCLREQIVTFLYRFAH